MRLSGILLVVALVLSCDGSSCVSSGASRKSGDATEAALATRGEAKHGELPQGIGIFEVTSTQATLWSRASRATRMHALVRAANGKEYRQSVAVGTERDFTGALRFEELVPSTKYRAYVWFSDDPNAQKPDHATKGEFRTAPGDNDEVAVRFAWSGDLGGQNCCRDETEGYPIFRQLTRSQPDFFVTMGDLIYADDVCKEQGLFGNVQVAGDFEKSESLLEYWRHWRYNLADKAWQELNAQVPRFAVWDDHEVVNDFGPQHDTARPHQEGTPLTPIGRKAYLHYNPIVARSHEKSGPLYRRHRWGKHLELVLLDTRSFRDDNAALDKATKKKSMLGEKQLAWLEAAIKSSDATWLVLASSVPISLPTGSEGKRDGWANYDGDTGFEQELAHIFATAQAAGRKKLVFLAADVHLAAAIQYQPPSAIKGAAGIDVLEFIAGPLSARFRSARDLDPTFRPTPIFFHSPTADDAPRTYGDAKRFFNAGLITIDRDGNLRVEVVNALGERVKRAEFAPAS